MKTLKCLFVITGLIYAFAACENAQDLIIEDELTESTLRAKSSKMVSVPFKAKLFTGQADDALTEICSFTSPTDFWGLEHQVGGGTATHLGNFTTDLKFCIHIVLDDQGLPDLEGGFGVFEDVEGYLEAANGDRLFTTSPGGSLNPTQIPGYNFEFENINYVTGGTGRFENASGEFVNYGLVRSDGTGTDHVQEGTIILPKKK